MIANVNEQSNMIARNIEAEQPDMLTKNMEMESIPKQIFFLVDNCDELNRVEKERFTKEFNTAVLEKTGPFAEMEKPKPRHPSPEGNPNETGYTPPPKEYMKFDRNYWCPACNKLLKKGLTVPCDMERFRKGEPKTLRKSAMKKVLFTFGCTRCSQACQIYTMNHNVRSMTHNDDWADVTRVSYFVDSPRDHGRQMTMKEKLLPLGKKYPSDFKKKAASKPITSPGFTIPVRRFDEELHEENPLVARYKEREAEVLAEMRKTPIRGAGRMKEQYFLDYYHLFGIREIQQADVFGEPQFGDTKEKQANLGTTYLDQYRILRTGFGPHHPQIRPEPRYPHGY